MHSNHIIQYVYDDRITYPFYIMGGDWGSAIAPVKEELPLKGDTIVGNGSILSAKLIRTIRE